MGLEIESHIDVVLEHTNGQIYKALEEIALTAEEYVVKKCPEDTGRLRNSITHEVDDCFYSSHTAMNELNSHMSLNTPNTLPRILQSSTIMGSMVSFSGWRRI